MYFGYSYDWTYILVIIGAGLTLLAQAFVTSNYNKYKTRGNDKGITGSDVARRILDSNGLRDVKVVEVAGTLTDHYDPTKRTVNLSTDIYKDTSIASIAVAAHECGHAIQDKVGYAFLRIRHMMVATVNLCSKLGYVVIFIGLLFGTFKLAMIGLLLLGAMLLFQLVTLPVEFNASKRAITQLKELNLTNDIDQNGVKNMLSAAAMTYVASLASTLLQLLRLFIIISSRRSDD